MTFIRFAILMLFTSILLTASYASNLGPRGDFKDLFEVSLKGDAVGAQILDFMPMRTGYGVRDFTIDMKPTSGRLAAFEVSYAGKGGWGLQMVVGRNSQEFCQFTIEDNNYEAEPRLRDVYCSDGWKVIGPVGRDHNYRVTVKSD